MEEFIPALVIAGSILVVGFSIFYLVSLVVCRSRVVINQLYPGESVFDGDAAHVTLGDESFVAIKGLSYGLRWRRTDTGEALSSEDSEVLTEACEVARVLKDQERKQANK